ncbi:MAG: hypothetical protein JXB13_04805 [Phycisphaerae bacterium]|nr:hypothetical protein [Phycisphaerae bacterium]
MATCFFVSDLHGRTNRYERLLSAVEQERPAAVFLGGDLLPVGLESHHDLPPDQPEFLRGFLVPRLLALRERLGPDEYPRVFLILGNDDSRSEEPAVLAGVAEGIWEYVHQRRSALGDRDIYGYACIPPSPFALKDWERYDVSRYVDPGSLSPEEGRRTVPADRRDVHHGTIARDLDALVGGRSVERAIFLFHAPPHDTHLDRAALDDRTVDHVPLDVHVGSIAVRRFIEQRRPWITLHGHVHESARLTGHWRQPMAGTWCFSAAHDGPELALVRFDPDDPRSATRSLL